MLSVWKLGHGQEAYYLEAVAQGVEDYYVGGEAPGRWIASSGTLLGLAGEVSADDLHAVLSGRDPSIWDTARPAAPVPGFDLTFRAPKSVSVLFGLGEPDTARQVRDAHDRRGRGCARLGRAPRRVVPSRARRRRAGARRGPDRRGVPASHVAQRRPAPSHPRARAEHGARRGRQVGDARRPLDLHVGQDDRLPLRGAAAPQPDRRPRRRVGTGPQRHRRHRATSPLEVLKAFSTRRAEIEERMAIRNQHSPKAAMIAALDTRRTKQPDPGAVELRARWAERAERDRLRPASAARRDRPRRADSDHRRGTAPPSRTACSAPTGLTAHDSSFDRDDILQAWCDALPAGAPIERIEELAELPHRPLETAPLHDVVPGHGRRDPRRLWPDDLDPAAAGAMDHVRAARHRAARARTPPARCSARSEPCAPSRSDRRAAATRRACRTNRPAP